MRGEGGGGVLKIEEKENGTGILYVLAGKKGRRQNNFYSKYKRINKNVLVVLVTHKLVLFKTQSCSISFRFTRLWSVCFQYRMFFVFFLSMNKNKYCTTWLLIIVGRWLLIMTSRVWYSLLQHK